MNSGFTVGNKKDYLSTLKQMTQPKHITLQNKNLSSNYMNILMKLKLSERT